ncbi:MAG: hydantoinase B/oxoprolinase family protein, partial [Betaproteobacteria bacterium]
AGEGGNTVVTIGGYHGPECKPFILVDMINGAWGGRSDKDGIEGITNPSQNMSNLPIETIEARYPVMMEEYALREDSGGAGQFRGGLGLVRQYRLLADTAILQLRADRHEHPPYGLFGGKAAASSRNQLKQDGKWRVLPVCACLAQRAPIAAGSSSKSRVRTMSSTTPRPIITNRSSLAPVAKASIS